MIPRRLGAAALLSLALLFAGVVSAGGASGRDGAPRMEKTPAYVLGYCRRSKRLPLACPRLLPKMEQPPPHWEVNICQVGHPGCRGLAWDGLSLVDAGNGDRPPIWSHVEIYVGDLVRAFQFAYPTHGPKPPHIDGLFARTRTHAIFLGSYTWGGKRGTVVLAPSYPGGGEQGDHVIFRWRQSGVGCAIGLHGWEPLGQALATLRVMVGSI